MKSPPDPRNIESIRMGPVDAHKPGHNKLPIRCIDGKNGGPCPICKYKGPTSHFYRYTMKDIQDAMFEYGILVNDDGSISNERLTEWARKRQIPAKWVNEETVS